MAKARNYKKEYARDHSSSKAKKARAKRNAANARLKPGPEVDHKRPLSKGGSNSSSNTRVVTRAANRKKGAKTTTTRKPSTRKTTPRRKTSTRRRT